MSKYKKGIFSNLNAECETQDVASIGKLTGNLYHAINVVAKRAVQINTSIKEELHAKLEEFVMHTDNLEEVFENREQIEISRFYERLPDSTILALAELNEEEIYHRNPQDELEISEA